MFAEVTLLHCSMVVVAVVMMNRTHKTKTNVCTFYYHPILLSLYSVLFLDFLRTGCNSNAGGANNFVYQRLS